jgi:hypothetical protein
MELFVHSTLLPSINRLHLTADSIGLASRAGFTAGEIRPMGWMRALFGGSTTVSQAGASKVAQAAKCTMGS